MRFTPETGTHPAGKRVTVGRIADIIWTSVAVVYLWGDPGPFFKTAAVVLLVFALFNHANRWSGWGERDSYTRSRRP